MSLMRVSGPHEVFANIYRRFDKHGDYRADSPEARIADRVRSFLRNSPVLLLTATPIQNNLTELWGLIQYVEPTGTLLGNLRTFRDVFCDGDDRTLVRGLDDELRRRIETVVQRTLRRQAQDFLERPFVARHAQIFEYSMTPREKLLYDQVTAYLLEPQLFAFRGNQRRLLLIGFHRLMGSSVAALTASLRKVAARLDQMLKGRTPDDLDTFLDDLEDEDLRLEPAKEETGAADVRLIEKELERVRSFVSLAEALHRDSKAEKLLDVIRVIAERPVGRQRAVIFTESLVTQTYLQDLLILKGGLRPEDITLFRGTNDSPRAAQALKQWQEEIGDSLPPHQLPSRSVALRLALVHEFRTKSRIFISTEAGAKGLNLQFCDTIVNYDLPWNPQRIEQRIGRCHRYGQEHDVTVINFLAADNEAQRLMFEILSRKLDLFGKVLDASDVVLHEPSTDTPETLAGAIGSDFEGRLRRIYERARTVGEIEAELRRLREEMEDERKRFEETWARTAGLIETRFDQRVRQVFHRLQADLPPSLARLDGEIDRLINGFLLTLGVQYRRIAANGNIRFELSACEGLPDGWRDGGVVAIGEARNLEDADPLHLGHPLVQAAVAEARDATRLLSPVAWVLDTSSPRELMVHKGKRGPLVLIQIRYDGFEKIDRLIPIAVVEGESSPLAIVSARWLLDHQPNDRPKLPRLETYPAELDDLIEEQVFTDQIQVAGEEQVPFDRRIEQIERYVEDQLMVLRRRLNMANESLRGAQDRRESALGAEVRSQAEVRVRAIQEEIDTIETEVSRLETRDDPRSKKQPVNVPEVVTTARVANGLGLIKISMFPGMVGIDVANSISAATRELAPDRLIVDLRGNTGGGMGCLRVMSYLCPDRRGVGHSVTRKRVEEGFDKETLPVFDRIPPTKLGLLPLIAKFALGDKSIAVKTEALGPQRFHGRIAVLVNQHSASASEMIAAFAAENGLATIVGEKTAGRVVGANSFKVGYGYRVALPVVEYRTWAGTVLESKGVVPDVLEPFSPDAAWTGVDGQVEKAIEIVNGLEGRAAIH